MPADLAPIAVVVTRYRCPFCPRSLSSKTRMVDHIGKCWRNPAVRSCKTCKHFVREEGEPEVGLPDIEDCEAGVDLRGGCATCGYVPPSGENSCPEHPLDDMRPPGPVVDCSIWEATDA